MNSSFSLYNGGGIPLAPAPTYKCKMQHVMPATERASPLSVKNTSSGLTLPPLRASDASPQRPACSAHLSFGALKEMLFLATLENVACFSLKKIVYL